MKHLHKQRAFCRTHSAVLEKSTDIPKQLEESTPGRAKTPKIGDRKVGLYFLNTTPLCDRRFVGSFRASWSGFFKLFRYRLTLPPKIKKTGG
jgi:hypothetical protein